MATVTILNCPYCGKSVSIEEYEQALEKVRLTLEKESREQLRKLKEQQRKEKENFEKQIFMIQEKQELQINQIKREVRDETRSLYDEEMKKCKKDTWNWIFKDRMNVQN